MLLTIDNTYNKVFSVVIDRKKGDNSTCITFVNYVFDPVWTMCVCLVTEERGSTQHTALSSELGSKWLRLALSVTNLGLFKVKFQYILWNIILKSLSFVAFVTKLAHLEWKPDIARCVISMTQSDHQEMRSQHTTVHSLTHLLLGLTQPSSRTLNIIGQMNQHVESQ